MTRTHLAVLSTLLVTMLIGPIALGQPATQPAMGAQTQPELTIPQLLNRAQQAAASRDFAAAVADLDRVVAAEPNNLNIKLTLADCLMSMGDQVRARQVYEDSLKIAPNDWRVHFGLGGLYLQREYYKLARPYLERATQLSPAQARAPVLVNLAMAHRGLHEIPEAMERARQAVALDSSNMDARQLLVGLYVTANRIDDALAENSAARNVVRQGLVEQPDDPTKVEQLLQNLSQETDLLGRKIATQPQDATLRLRMVEAMEQQVLVGQQLTYHRALNVLEPVVSQSSGNIDLLLARARLLYLVGRSGPAAEDLRKVLAMAPDNTTAKQLLAKIESVAGASQPAR